MSVIPCSKGLMDEKLNLFRELKAVCWRKLSQHWSNQKANETETRTPTEKTKQEPHRIMKELSTTSCTFVINCLSGDTTVNCDWLFLTKTQSINLKLASFLYPCISGTEC